MDLFAHQTQPVVQLLEDDEGGIRYWPAILTPEQAQASFEALLPLPWHSQRRQMYEREVDVPRLLFFCRFDEVDCPPQLHRLREIVQCHVPAGFTSAGLNFYRDGSDSVAMHGDKLHHLAAGQPVAIVSLGATRRMLIRERRGARDTLRVDLVAGSLLVMSHASQRTHEHGIPKTSAAVGPRISVALRVRPASSD